MQMVTLTGAARELQEEMMMMMIMMMMMMTMMVMTTTTTTMMVMMMMMIGLLFFSANRHQPRSDLAEIHQQGQCLVPLAWTGLVSLRHRSWHGYLHSHAASPHSSHRFFSINPAVARMTAVRRWVQRQLRRHH